VCLLACARDASAQVGTAWTERGYFNFSIGFEAGSGELNDTATQIIYPGDDELASLSVSQAVDSGSFIDFSGGARVWQNVTAGLAFHQGSTHSESALTGSIPHPLFPNQYRPLAVNTADLDRMERAIHLQVGYMLPVNDQLFVHVTIGPSFFTLHQDVVSDVDITDSADFRTVTGTGVITQREDSPVGFNIGADVSYQLYQREQFKLGAGMFLRYAGASATVQVLDASNARLDSDVGGLQVGFGIRTRF
jgi:hypothetical protein